VNQKTVNQKKKRNRLTALLLLLVAVTMTLVVGCGGDDDEAPGGDTKQYGPGVTDTEIKIGGIYPFSGPVAAYGTIGKTVEAYFTMVNEQGGINGRKITFVTRDDAYSPDRTVQSARELVEQEKVLLLFNPLGTPPNSAIWDYMNQQKVPHLFVATGASKWGADPKSRQWTIGWQPDYVSESAIYVQWLAREKPNAKVAILYQNDDYGKDYLDGFKKALGNRAAQVIVREATYASTDVSVSAQVAQLRDSGADTFFLIATPKFATQALIAATQIGWKPTIILNSVSQSIPAVLDPAAQQGADLTNIITTFYIKDPGDPQWANDKAISEYKEFMAKYYPAGNVMDGFNVYGYAVAQTLVEVLKKSGDNLTRENVLRQATSLKDLRIDVLLPGILINTSPVDAATPDYYPIQAMQLAKFNPTAKKWDLFGEVIDTGKK
jgi:branched-chain amino acid transport system substrate-binding protein